MNIASFIFRPDEVSSEDTITGCKVDTATYVTVDKEELENIDSRKHPQSTRPSARWTRSPSPASF
jgi:hypothetical protein